MKIQDNKFAYGEHFQVKIIAACLLDQNYYNQYFDVIDYKYFDSQPLATIYKSFKQHYLKQGYIPTFDILGFMVTQIQNEVLRESCFAQLKRIYMSMKDKDLQFVKQRTAAFCKNQKLKEAIIESSKYIFAQDYQKIRTILDKALSVGQTNRSYIDYVQNFDKRYSPDQRKCVQTPWTVITQLMGGGLGRAQLGVIGAAQGVGKSWQLTQIGVRAMNLGLKVAHIGLQLTQQYAFQRYDAALFNMPFGQLVQKHEQIRHRVQKYQDQLKIKNFPPGTITVSTIKATLRLMIARGFTPNVLIIDYADLLRQDSKYRSNSLYEQQGQVYLELRALAKQFDIPVWTASQLNREATTANVVTNNMLSDSFKKGMHADFLFGMSRTLQDKTQGTCRFTVLKNRQGADGITFTGSFNSSTGKLQIYPPNSQMHRQVKQKMDSRETVIKQLIKQRLSEI